MAWNSATDLVVGSGGQVNVAPSGTAVPTTTTGALNAAFVGLGYLDEDGVTITITPNIQEFNVWQSQTPARRENLARTTTVSGNLAQWDEDTTSVVFTGALGNSSGSTPNYTVAFPSDNASLGEMALVVDVTDGSENHRFAFGRVNQTGEATIQFNRSNLAVLPIEFGVLAPAAGGSPGSYYTDSASFAAGS